MTVRSYLMEIGDRKCLEEFIDTVNLQQRRCTCRLWDLSGIPCPHAIKAMMYKRVESVGEIY